MSVYLSASTTAQAGLGICVSARLTCVSVCLSALSTGGFACMCGAALSGAISHSISISVIVFELTGQITYVLPILTSVLVANALSRHLQPSFFDSNIKAKKITVLPKMVLSKIPGGQSQWEESGKIFVIFFSFLNVSLLGAK